MPMGPSTTRRLLLAGLLLFAACGPAAEPSLLVHAAASLRDVATRIGARYTRAHGIPVIFNFAGSNVLAQQIAATGQGDVLLSADLAWLDELEARGCLASATRRPFLRSRLVVAAHAESTWQIQAPCDLGALPFGHLAIAHPGGVPAGRYAKAWASGVACGESNLWASLADRVTPAKDVRAALALIEADPATIGIVYASDAATRESVRVFYEPPASSQPDVIYGAAVLSDSRLPAAAADFLTFLQAPAQAEIFAACGMEALAR